MKAPLEQAALDLEAALETFLQETVGEPTAAEVRYRVSYASYGVKVWRTTLTRIQARRESEGRA